MRGIRDKRVAGVGMTVCVRSGVGLGDEVEKVICGDEWILKEEG